MSELVNQSHPFSPYQQGQNDFFVQGPSSQKENKKRGCSKTKLMSKVCSKLLPTLNDFPADVGLIVGDQPVFKAGRLAPRWREITSDPNILQYVQCVKISFV